jgi:hypothetical protein
VLRAVLHEDATRAKTPEKYRGSEDVRDKELVARLVKRFSHIKPEVMRLEISRMGFEQEKKTAELQRKAATHELKAKDPAGHQALAGTLQREKQELEARLKGFEEEAGAAIEGAIRDQQAKTKT